MFSSNQILEISGSIEHKEDLYKALKFVLDYSGDLECFKREKEPAKCVYQITKDGRYCLGWSYGDVKMGWNEFEFDFNLKKISKIIKNHLDKQKLSHSEYDGTYKKGFLLKPIEKSFADEKNGIKKPFYGIIEIKPYACFYHK